ncbi:uncharacterized protein LOC123536063 isoform X2 [Mercenaria mercenaria]|uniref:uncharacterized protein LOC123536063 isoform X2 n=1 Tax=Mercenaria mercenaria TaxID=6596 RepID=UPI00234F8DE4|nr:uncharacterized protein LOC123536063 isoform X2 [Mercenaria mercenaria]
MEDNNTEKRSEGPMSDGEYIRKTDYKEFDPEGDVTEVQNGCQLISEMLQQEYMRDYKLQPSSVATNNVPRYKFPFNRHTVTIGIGNVVIDFEVARKQHEKIQEDQRRFAEEIEKVKEEMEKVRLIESAWYDDFLNNKYVNDLTIELARNKARGVGDACAKTEELMTEPERNQKDENGILHVRAADERSSQPTIKPKGRYIVPFKESISSLPNVSI